MAYADPERQKRAQHESYVRNREKVRERSKAWKAANREKINASKRGMTVEEYCAWKVDADKRAAQARNEREERRRQREAAQALLRSKPKVPKMREPRERVLTAKQRREQEEAAERREELIAAQRKMKADAMRRLGIGKAA